MLRYGHLTEADKRQICEWHYDGVYAIYDLPAFESMKKREMGFLNPQRDRNFLGFWEDGILIGYVNLREEEQEVFIGIGIRPEFCGYGYGSCVLTKACEISKERYPEKSLYLEVRHWNIRSVRCYEKSGFHIAGSPFLKETHNGTDWFYRMVKK